MMTLTDIAMRFGGQTLYEGVNWQLNPGTHYGLVGANGSGKSTLIRIMAGELAPSDGNVGRIASLRLGTLGQDHFRFDEERVIDVVQMGRPELWEVLEERRRLLAVPNGASGEQNAEASARGERLSELELLVADLGGYQAEAEAAALLAGLGLAQGRHERSMGELSGGFRLRVLLAQTLFGAPDLLLLDEPTNHLDIASIRWLESYLREFRGTFVVISHDRHFLNSVCDSIADVDYQELRVYPGNYDAFERAKTLAVTQRDAEIARTEQRIEELQQFIDRFRAKATKARQASARKKQVEKMELPEVKRSSRRFPSFVFAQRRPSGREVLRVEGVRKTYGTQVVLHDVTFSLERGERVAVIGPNGVGKSTLLRVITGETEADEGAVLPGHELAPGYFAQDHHEQLKGRETAYEWLSAAGGSSDIPTVRGALGRVLFSGDEAAKQVADLSGGESARLLLGALMLRQPNLLILDEPTNHLDLEGREALMSALTKYPGSVLFVSHDRHFVSAVGTRVLALSPEGLEDFAGDYEQYLAKHGEDYLAIDGARPRGASRAAGAAGAAGEGYAERKGRRRNVAQLRRTVARLELEIASSEAELERLEASFSNGEYYLRASRDQVAGDAQRRDTLQATLAKALPEWEAAAAELESADPE